MHRQTLVPGALEALGRIGETADIVILTNLPHKAHPWRVGQLARHDIHHEIVCNSGGKGEPLKRLVERHGASAASSSTIWRSITARSPSIRPKPSGCT